MKDTLFALLAASLVSATPILPPEDHTHSARTISTDSTLLGISPPVQPDADHPHTGFYNHTDSLVRRGLFSHLRNRVTEANKRLCSPISGSLPEDYLMLWFSTYNQETPARAIADLVDNNALHYPNINPSILEDLVELEGPKKEDIVPYTKMTLRTYPEILRASQKPPLINLSKFATRANPTTLDIVELFLAQDTRACQYPNEGAGAYFTRLVKTYFLDHLGVPYDELNRGDFGVYQELGIGPTNDNVKHAEELIRRLAKSMQQRQKSFFGSDSSGIPNKVEFFFMHRQPNEDDVEYSLRVVNSYFRRRPAVYTVFYPQLFTPDVVESVVRGLKRSPQNGDLWGYARSLIKAYAYLISKEAKRSTTGSPEGSSQTARNGWQT